MRTATTRATTREPPRGPRAAGMSESDPQGSLQGPSGVPPRPSPLPPPRANQVPPGGIEGSASGSTTVVPERGARAAAPRQPLARPVAPARGRRAKLAVRRLDPWSVFVVSLLLSLFLAVVTIVAAFVLYVVLSVLGVPDSVNKAVTDVNGGGPLLTQGRFVGIGALVAAANVVLITALATLSAMIYNVCATFTGGIEVTLAERE